MVRLSRDDQSSVLIFWLEQCSTTKSTGARLDSACRSMAQRALEHGSTAGMFGAVLDDRLVGAKLDSQGHRSRARQCLPEQGSTAPGARLDRDDRSRAQRSLGWSKAQQPRAQEQGSTGKIGAVLHDRLVGARFSNQAHWNSARQ